MNQKIRNIAIIISIVGGLIAIPNYANAGLFNTVEFKANSLKALPKWTRVIDKFRNETPAYFNCDRDISTCNSHSLVSWRAFVNSQQGKSKWEQVKETNQFLNQWPYILDVRNWGITDYWASPLEFLKKSGDCEDYSIIKYVTLKELGIPPENMRIVVVQDTVRNIAHAVLAVYLDDRKEPVILDSLFDAVLSHKKIMQYSPHYSVNETTRWAHVKPLRRKK